MAINVQHLHVLKSEADARRAIEIGVYYNVARDYFMVIQNRKELLYISMDAFYAMDIYELYVTKKILRKEPIPQIRALNRYISDCDSSFGVMERGIVE